VLVQFGVWNEAAVVRLIRSSARRLSRPGRHARPRAGRLPNVKGHRRNGDQWATEPVI